MLHALPCRHVNTSPMRASRGTSAFLRPPGQSVNCNGLVASCIAELHDFRVPVVPGRVHVLRPPTPAVDADVDAIPLGNGKLGTKRHIGVKKVDDGVEVAGVPGLDERLPARALTFSCDIARPVSRRDDWTDRAIIARIGRHPPLSDDIRPLGQDGSAGGTPAPRARFAAFCRSHPDASHARGRWFETTRAHR